MKNLTGMTKSIKQLDIDIKNVQNQKGDANPDDKFVEVMSDFVEMVSYTSKHILLRKVN